jgi:hypothetical protein
MTASCRTERNGSASDPGASEPDRLTRLGARTARSAEGVAAEAPAARVETRSGSRRSDRRPQSSIGS